MINYTPKINQQVVPQTINDEQHIVGITATATYTPTLIRLIQVPQQALVSTVSIWSGVGHTGTQYTEITLGIPSTFEFLVDYVTGVVTFNSSQDSNTVYVSYLGLGSEVAAEDINEIQNPLSAVAAQSIIYNWPFAPTVTWTLAPQIVTPSTISTTITDNFTFPNDVIVAGDLTVQGTTTTVESTIVTFQDPLLELNFNNSLNPTTFKAGLKVIRGVNPTAEFVWSEAITAWVLEDILGNPILEAFGSGASIGDVNVTGHLDINSTTNQLVLGTTRTVTITAPTPVTASRTVTIPDLSASYSVVGTEGTQTVNGNKTLTGTINLSSLTASLPLQLDASKNIVSTAIDLSTSQVTGVLPVVNGGTEQSSYTDGQLLIGKTAGNTLNKTTLTGTANQVIITNGSGTITLSTPQNINTGASPTFASETLTNTTNQLVLGITNTTTINSTAPVAARVYTIPDAGTSTANFILDKGNYTIGGTWNFSNDITLASSKSLILTDNTANTVAVKATNSTTSYTLSLPTTSGTNGFFLQTDGSGNTTWASGGSGTISVGTQFQLAYYAANGNTISGLTLITANKALVSDTNGLPVASTTTATEILSLATLLSARRPNLVYSSATVVTLETGIITGTSGDATIVFPDGDVRTETNSVFYNMNISTNAVFNGSPVGANQGGLRTGSASAFTWYACYAVKVSTFTGRWVMVADTVLPIVANYSTLNTNFGTDSWVYLGLIKYGYKTGDTAIVQFVQDGKTTYLNNGITGGNTSSGQALNGLIWATSASANSLTVAYTAGTSGTNTPNNINAFYMSLYSAANGSRIADSGGTKVYLRQDNGWTGQIKTWMPAINGVQAVMTGGADYMDLTVQGWTDDVLGVGSNPLL